jgi:hypothetical protein
MFVALSGCRFEEAALDAPGKFPRQQRGVTSHIWQGIAQSFWEAASCRGREVEAPPFSVCEGGEEGAEGAVERVCPLVLPDSVVTRHKSFRGWRWAAPTTAWKCQRCLCFGAQPCIINRTRRNRGAIFHSPYHEERTSRAYASCLWPAAFCCNIP